MPETLLHCGIKIGGPTNTLTGAKVRVYGAGGHNPSDRWGRIWFWTFTVSPTLR